MGDRFTLYDAVAPLLRCLPIVACELDETSHELRVDCRGLTLYVASATPGATDSSRLLRWHARRDALELLALVWLVDRDAWMYLLAEFRFARFARPLRSATTEPPAYVLHFTNGENPRFIERVLELLATPAEDFERSKRFLAARDELLASASSGDVQSKWEALQVPLRLVQGEPATVSSGLLAKWVRRPGRFTVASVSVWRHQLRVASDTINATHELVARGTPLLEVGFASFSFADTVTRHEVAQHLDDLLSPCGATILDCRQMTQPSAIGALLSSFAHPRQTTQVHTLKLPDLVSEGTRATRVSSLLWLFYGVFREDACHSIGCFRSNLGDSEDVVWLAEYMKSRGGSPRLELLILEVFDDFADAEMPTHDVWVTVPRGEHIRVRIDDVAHDEVPWFDDQEMRFRVIRDEPTSTFIDILVPGYGRCWIERSEAVVITHEPLTIWRFDRHSVRAMELAFSHCNVQERRNVEAFLSLVGAPVKTLVLRRHFARDHRLSEGLDDASLMSIAKACPQLFCLTLDNVPLVSFDALVNMYERLPCRVRALTLGDHQFIDHSDLLLFLDALGDHTLKITNALEELAIDLSSESPSQMEVQGIGNDEVVMALLRMLECNHALAVVHVVLASDQFARLQFMFDSHRERLIPRQKAPMPRRERWAMLSVLSRVTSLDKRVFSRVFDFAAECKTRTVTVTRRSVAE